MAVCGHCWLCLGKFECGWRRACMSCAKTGREPAAVECGGETVGHVCFSCRELVATGALAAMIDAHETLAGQAAAREREACARLVDELAFEPTGDWIPHLIEASELIRRRGG